MEQNPPVWMDGTTVPGEDLRRLTTALMSDGVAEASALAVSEKSGTPNMSVDVAAGAAFVLGTNQTYQGTYFVENRATVNKTISAAHPTNGRIDLVVARVRENLYDSGGVDAWDIYVVTGTPAGSPVAPAVPDNCLALAEVSVPAADTAIGNAQITDRRSLARPWNAAWGEVAYAAATAASAGYTSESDISGVSVTWDAVDGRLYEVLVRVPVADSTSAGTLATMITDSSNTRYGQGNHSIAAGGSANFTVTARVVGAGASVTRKARFISTGGSGTLTATANVPVYISVRDLGPA